MVRKTRKEALETRDGILDAAERVFHRKGVARTSLSEVASEAGVTRGAIYWHFSNKGELFDAMMRRAIEPLEVLGEVDYDAAADPLLDLRTSMLSVLERILSEPRYLRVLSIAWHKCEYVDEMVATVDRCLEAGARHLGRVEHAFRAAQGRGQVPASVDAHLAAMGLTTLVDGLIGNWTLQPQSITLAHAAQWIDCYLRGVRASD